MTLFSVIIPAFNRAKIINRAINSILEQTFSDFEIIVVDDGSTDDTKNKVLSIRDSRIKYIYQSNNGVCAARNYGFSVASSEYIAFLDSDDYVENNWLEDFRNEILLDSPDLVFCNVKLLDLSKNTEKIIKASDPYSLGATAFDGIYLAGAFCVKSTFFKRIGSLDEKLKFGEFIEFRLRCIRNQNTKCFTNKLGLIYEASSDGGSTNLLNRIESNLYVLEKHKEYFDTHKNDKKNYLSITAVAAIKTGNYNLGHELFKKSFFNTPLNFKVFTQFLFSFSPFFGKFIWKTSNNDTSNLL